MQTVKISISLKGQIREFRGVLRQCECSVVLFKQQGSIKASLQKMFNEVYHGTIKRDFLGQKLLLIRLE